jgi:hypothetical protein
MNMIQGVGYAACVPATCATNATAGLCVDTKGYDYATVRVMWGTNISTSAARFLTLYVRESDTVTSPTSMTSIVAFNGGTATSSTVGFVFPEATAGATSGGALTFSVDLKARKRYLGLAMTPGGASNFVAAEAICSRAGESKDTTTTAKVTNNVASNVNPVTHLIIG